MVHPFLPPGLTESGSQSCALQSWPLGSVLSCLHLILLPVVFALLVGFSVASASLLLMHKPCGHLLPSPDKYIWESLPFACSIVSSVLDVNGETPISLLVGPSEIQATLQAASGSYCSVESSLNRYCNSFCYCSAFDSSQNLDMVTWKLLWKALNVEFIMMVWESMLAGLDSIVEMVIRSY